MDIRHWFLKYAWTVNLFLLAVVAYVSAQTANQSLANQLLLKPSDTPAVRTSAPDQVPDYRPPLEAIVGRDLFKAAEKGAGVTVEPGAGDTAELKETTLRLELKGVVFLGPDYPENIATILNRADQKIGLFQVGDTVTEDSNLHTVELDRIVLARSNGEHEVLTLERGDKKPAPGPGSPRAGLSPQERAEDLRGRRDALQNLRATEGPDLSDRIKQISETEYVIQKDAIEETMSDLNSIVTQARVIPNFEGEGDQRQVTGFRIYRIKPNSVFQFLGLKNGDVINAINGEKMDTVEKGLQLLQSLRNETSFTINLQRHGSQSEFHYEVE